MKFLNLKSLVLALGLSLFASLNASATTVDLGVLPTDTLVATSFTQAAGPVNDLLTFTIGDDSLFTEEGFAWTGKVGQTFQTSIYGLQFDLYKVGDADKYLGFDGYSFSVFNLDSGDYYFKISGTALSAKSGYTISLSATPTAPVPEPETYAMMLAGLGLMGFIARRRKG